MLCVLLAKSTFHFSLFLFFSVVLARIRNKSVLSMLTSPMWLTLVLAGNLFARTTDPLRVPPLVFTREDRPDRVYGFKQGAYFKSSTAGQDTSSAAGSDVVKVQRMRMQSCIQISFGDPIPTQPAVTSEDGLSAQQKRIVTVLRDVFKRRPVWLRSQLKVGDACLV